MTRGNSFLNISPLCLKKIHSTGDNMANKSIKGGLSSMKKATQIARKPFLTTGKPNYWKLCNVLSYFFAIACESFFFVQRVKPINDDTSFFNDCKFCLEYPIECHPHPVQSLFFVCIWGGEKKERSNEKCLHTNERTNDWWFGYKVYRLNDILDLLWWILFSQHFFFHVYIFSRQQFFSLVPLFSLRFIRQFRYDAANIREIYVYNCIHFTNLWKYVNASVCAALCINFKMVYEMRPTSKVINAIQILIFYRSRFFKLRVLLLRKLINACIKFNLTIECVAVANGVRGF